MTAPSAAGEPSAAALVITGPLSLADISPLCERVRALIEVDSAGHVVCDVAELGAPDAVAIDVLARLQLMAAGSGRRIVLRHASSDLRALIGLTGMCGVLIWRGESRVQMRRQPEEGKEPGVEEVRDLDDPAL